MASGKATVCFIDDDPAELRRFEKAFRDDFNVIVGTTYTDAMEKLKEAGRGSPHLWVLDLYFPDPSHSNTPEELHEMSGKFEAFDRSRRVFLKYLHSIKQGRDGGLKLLDRCRENHRVPVVMFTRKGTIDDAIECLSEGAVEVLKKPMPPKLPDDPDERSDALDNALIEARAFLKDRFTARVIENTHWVKNRARYLAVLTFILGILLDRGLVWIGL